jgi:hypothetical protein
MKGNGFETFNDCSFPQEGESKARLYLLVNGELISLLYEAVTEKTW